MYIAKTSKHLSRLHFRCWSLNLPGSASSRYPRAMFSILGLLIRSLATFTGSRAALVAESMGVRLSVFGNCWQGARGSGGGRGVSDAEQMMASRKSADDETFIGGMKQQFGL